MNSWCYPYVLEKEAELDEKYLVRSHKGSRIEGVKSYKRGHPASKRGISDEQVCILTSVQRLSGHAFATTVNIGRPSMEDLKEISHYIGNSSYVWTDGLQGYSSLLEEKECTHKILESKESYDSVNHLNNVNSFHSRIQKQYTEYRGVATKYINRYNALFVLQHEYRGMDP